VQRFYSEKVTRLELQPTLITALCHEGQKGFMKSGSNSPSPTRFSSCFDRLLLPLILTHRCT